MVTRKENGIDNEQSPAVLHQLISEMHGNHSVMMQKFETLSAKFEDISNQLKSVITTLDRHMSGEDKEIKMIKDSLQAAVSTVEDKVLAGFPNKDPIRHHDYHVAVIDDTKDKKKRNQEVLTFIIKSTLWAVLVIVGTALWFYVKAQLHLP